MKRSIITHLHLAGGQAQIQILFWDYNGVFFFFFLNNVVNFRISSIQGKLLKCIYINTSQMGWLRITVTKVTQF